MTGFTGVFQEPDYVARRRGLRAHKFVAEAMLHGKKVSLGHFPTAILAAVHRARALRGAHRMSQVSSLARSDLVNAVPSSSLLCTAGPRRGESHSSSDLPSSQLNKIRKGEFLLQTPAPPSHQVVSAVAAAAAAAIAAAQAAAMAANIAAGQHTRSETADGLSLRSSAIGSTPSDSASCQRSCSRGFKMLEANLGPGGIDAIVAKANARVQEAAAAQALSYASRSITCASAHEAARAAADAAYQVAATASLEPVFAKPEPAPPPRDAASASVAFGTGAGESAGEGACGGAGEGEGAGAKADEGDGAAENPPSTLQDSPPIPPIGVRDALPKELLGRPPGKTKRKQPSWRFTTGSRPVTNHAPSESGRVDKAPMQPPPPPSQVVSPVDMPSHLVSKWPHLRSFLGGHAQVDNLAQAVALAEIAAATARKAAAKVEAAVAAATKHAETLAEAGQLSLEPSARNCTGFKSVQYALQEWPFSYLVRASGSNDSAGFGVLTSGVGFASAPAGDILGYFPTAAEASLRGAQHAEQVRLAKQNALVHSSVSSRQRSSKVATHLDASSSSRSMGNAAVDGRRKKPRLKGNALLRAWASRFQDATLPESLSRRSAPTVSHAQVTVPPASIPPGPASKRLKLLPSAEHSFQQDVSAGVRIGGSYQACLPACDRKTSSDRADVLMPSADVGMSEAHATAALLTSAAYGPMNEWSFVSPSDCGLGLFARVPLRKDQPIGEYGGPRLPSRLHTNGQYVLQVPDSSEIIDGAFENSPFDDGPRWPVVFANHSRASPNAQLLYFPTLRPEACELRGRMWIVATECIPAGSEIRIDYEAGESSTYWLAGQPEENSRWRTHFVQPPPPTAEEPLFCSSMKPETGQEAGMVARLPWEGEGGGDRRLEKLIPLLVPAGLRDRPGRHWGLVATHLPGRSGRESFDRWLYLHAV